MKTRSRRGQGQSATMDGLFSGDGLASLLSSSLTTSDGNPELEVPAAASGHSFSQISIYPDAARLDDDEGQATVAEAPEATSSRPSTGEETEPTSGVIDPIEGEPVERPGEEGEGDVVRSAQTAERDSPRRLRVSAQLTVQSGRSSGTTGRASGDYRHQRHDAVKGALGTSGSVAQGGVTVPGDAFGVEVPTISVKDISYKADKSEVAVKGTVNVDCKWDVHALGRSDVTSEASAAITDKTWNDVATDLKPDGTGRPTRASYWASDLTSRHERFHATDDTNRVRLYVPTAQTWLDGQSVDPAKADAEVKGLMGRVRDMVRTDMDDWYSKGGENRAYADGRSSYEGRVKAVKDRASKEGWK